MIPPAIDIDGIRARVVSTPPIDWYPVLMSRFEVLALCGEGVAERERNAELERELAERDRDRVEGAKIVRALQIQTLGFHLGRKGVSLLRDLIVWANRGEKK